MPRNTKPDYIETPRNHVRVGRKIKRGLEPVALVGPVKNKDTFSLQEFAEELYGPGTQCYVILPNGKERDV